MKILNLILLSIILSLGYGCDKVKNDNRASLKILSTPEKAKVYCQAREIGQTPLEIKVRPGTYVFKISKAAYKSSWTKAICAPKTSKTLEVKLDQVTASAIITSTPKNAEVIYQGKPVGETPYTFKGLPVGKHSATVKLHGYQTREISWLVENNRPQMIKVDLSSNVGTLKVNSKPSKAKILIDAQSRGTTPFSGKLVQGEHKIKISKPGYAPYEEVVNIKRNSTTSKTANLSILPGSISISSKPGKATVTINGRRYPKTPTTVKDLAPGKYVIKLALKGFDPVIRNVNLPAGQSINISVNMDSNTGAIDLVANPPGVTIYLDGKKVGISQAGENKKISKVFHIGNLSAEMHTIEAWHKRAVPQKKQLRVKVRKGKTTRIPNINMWIADTIITFKKDNRKITGRLNTKNNKEIIFEPEPGVKQAYKLSELKSIEPLQYEE